MKRIALALTFAVLASSGTTAGSQTLKAAVLPSCPVTAPTQVDPNAKSSVIAGVLIQALIAGGVDIAATALAEAAKDKTLTISGDSEPAPYYQVKNGELGVSPKVGCIVVSAGGDTSASKGGPAWIKKAVDQKVVAGSPDFYLEIELRALEATNGLRASPKLLYVSDFFEKGNWFSRSSTRDYVVAIALNGEDTGESFGALKFAFKDVSAGKSNVKVAIEGVGGDRLADWPADVTSPKMPAGEDVTGVQAKQKTALAPFSQSNAIRKAAASVRLDKDPPDNNKAYIDKVAALCDLAGKADKAVAKDQAKDAGKPEKVNDPRCPVEVWQARIAADRAGAEAATQSDIKWANAFFTAYCAGKKKDDHGTKPDGSEGPKVEVCKPDDIVKDAGAFRLNVSVVETAEASKFIKVLASAFGAKKAEITTAINDRVNPVRRADLAAAEETSERGARLKYDLALLKVSKLQAQLDEASASSNSAKIGIQIDLAQAKIDANTAARGAGVTPVPYPAYD